jgi:hypothetical protein
MDTSKFKKEADLKLVMKMLLWMADGFMNEIKGMPDSAFDIYCNEFYGCMKLMKNSLYKEEFLS